MKNKFIYFIICFFIYSYINGQNNNVPEKYRLLAMLSLFSEGLNLDYVEINEENLVKFLSENVEINIINQNSFEDFVFLSLTINKKSKYNSSEMPIIWALNGCNEYIVSINKNTYYYYKLKGYQMNEFYSLLYFMRKYDYKKIKNPRVFDKNYQVKGLDFKCLYRSLKVNNYSQLKEFPCIYDTCLNFITTQ
ncbi:MAG: hypothetical protein QM499_11625 [Flavobacteriaceae bacterium]